jgi:predicted Zn-dependent peptidase
LGRAIIGRSSVIASTSVQEIARFHRRRYVPANIVIAAAGAVDHDALVKLAAERVPDGRRRAAPKPGSSPSRSAPGRRFESKETEQFHVCLGAPGISRHDERRYALRVLDTIFGGTSSSRLFQEVRERRGLAYAVYSFASGYQDSGQVGLYVGTRSDNLAEALAVISRELEQLMDKPASAEELRRAKENLKGRVMLALESTGARMNRLGSEVLAGAPLESLDEVVEQIEAVNEEDLAELAAELWPPASRSAAAIGPDAARFDEAIASLAPAAAPMEPPAQEAAA